MGTCVLLMGVTMSVLFGCAENKLKKAIEQASQNCPMSLGITSELTNFVYEDNVVKILMTMDDQFINIEQLPNDPEELKSMFWVSFYNSKSLPLLELITEADAGLYVVYKGKTSGKKAEIRFTADELKQRLEKPMATNAEKLKMAIAETNLQMPIDAGGGIIMTEIVDKGDVVAYMAKVEDMEQFKYIASLPENVKNSQQMMFKMFGPAEKAFFRLIAVSRKNLGYIYYTEGTDETVEIIHTNSELREIFK